VNDDADFGIAVSVGVNTGGCDKDFVCNVGCACEPMHAAITISRAEKRIRSRVLGITFASS
jgi:hypothetical protein